MWYTYNTFFDSIWNDISREEMEEQQISDPIQLINTQAQAYRIIIKDIKNIKPVLDEIRYTPNLYTLNNLIGNLKRFLNWLEGKKTVEENDDVKMYIDSLRHDCDVFAEKSNKKIQKQQARRELKKVNPSTLKTAIGTLMEVLKELEKDA